MKIKNLDGWNKFVEINSHDGYSKGVVDYSVRWAELMESELAIGSSLESIADRTSHEADTDGITGFMYGCAVQSLSEFWEYGDRLRRWHNLDTQIGNEGVIANENGGTLNPALISFRISNELA